MQQPTGAAALVRADFDVHYDAVWAPHIDAWADDAVLTVSWDADLRPGQKKPAHLSEHHPVRDRDAVWAAIVRRGSDRKVFVSVAPRSLTLLEALLATKNAKLDSWKRPQTLMAVSGGVREALAMPAMFADIDVLGGAHKAPNLPTRAEADDLLADFPTGPPTLLIWTGGGYHMWWAFNTLPGRAQEDDANARLQGWLNAAFEAQGWHVDDTQNRGVCTRPAGSLIGKGGNLRAITLLSPAPLTQAVAA